MKDYINKRRFMATNWLTTSLNWMIKSKIIIILVVMSLGSLGFPVRLWVRCLSLQPPTQPAGPWPCRLKGNPSPPSERHQSKLQPSGLRILTDTHPHTHPHTQTHKHTDTTLYSRGSTRTSLPTPLNYICCYICCCICFQAALPCSTLLCLGKLVSLFFQCLCWVTLYLFRCVT